MSDIVILIIVLLVSLLFLIAKKSLFEPGLENQIQSSEKELLAFAIAIKTSLENNPRALQNLRSLANGREIMRVLIERAVEEDPDFPLANVEDVYQMMCSSYDRPDFPLVGILDLRF